jgi:PPOX class probable F420-dependent enzyme
VRCLLVVASGQAFGRRVHRERGRNAMVWSRMSESEVWAFLADPVRPAVLSTTRADGRAHCAPISYLIAGHTIVFITGRESVKGRNLRRDPRLSLCVQDEEPPHSFTTVEGVAQLSFDADDLREIATRLGARYNGDERAEEFGRRNSGSEQLIARVTVTHVVGTNNVADYPAPE